MQCSTARSALLAIQPGTEEAASPVLFHNTFWSAKAEARSALRASRIGCLLKEPCEGGGTNSWSALTLRLLLPHHPLLAGLPDNLPAHTHVQHSTRPKPSVGKALAMKITTHQEAVLATVQQGVSWV